jgi:hypothetical protein
MNAANEATLVAAAAFCSGECDGTVISDLDDIITTSHGDYKA